MFKPSLHSGGDRTEGEDGIEARFVQDSLIPMGRLVSL